MPLGAAGRKTGRKTEPSTLLRPGSRLRRPGRAPGPDEGREEASVVSIYLPIAETSVDLSLLLGIGGGVGFMSGLFGVGGGFLLTPLLIFANVPPTVAVATGGNHVAGSSFSALLTHWRRGGVDPRMGTVLLIAGVLGSATGVRIFRWLVETGQVDLVVALSYVTLLGVVGALMLAESARDWLRRGAPPPPPGPPSRFEKFIRRLPFKRHFPRSALTISLIPPLLIGFAVGVLSAVMGVGGGFVMVPAMLYILKMPARVVVGTSLMQITVVAAASTLMHAYVNQTVDVVLALVLLVGGVVGAQIGAIFGARLRAERFQFLLAALVLVTAGRLAYDLVARPGPEDLYVIRHEEGSGAWRRGGR